ncbi:hypothetical protein EDB87DRAFT_308925 [Lactarius vividus]|nr:hypothetical protein EDB87DRAFT_308925 [Lactarius vividus]
MFLSGELGRRHMSRLSRLGHVVIVRLSLCYRPPNRGRHFENLWIYWVSLLHGFFFSQRNASSWAYHTLYYDLLLCDIHGVFTLVSNMCHHPTQMLAGSRWLSFNTSVRTPCPVSRCYRPCTSLELPPGCIRSNGARYPLSPSRGLMCQSLEARSTAGSQKCSSNSVLLSVHMDFGVFVNPIVRP